MGEFFILFNYDKKEWLCLQLIEMVSFNISADNILVNLR